MNDIKSFKQVDHSTSFDELEKALLTAKDGKKGSKFKGFPLYRIAASITIGLLIFVACSLPVSSEEELGFALTGSIEYPVNEVFNEFQSLEWVDKLTITGDVSQPGANQNFVILLPQSTFDLASEKANSLKKLPFVSDVNVEQIKAKVEQPLYVAIMKRTFHLDTDNRSNQSQHEKAMEQYNWYVKGVVDKQKLPNIKARYTRDEEGKFTLEFLQLTEN